MKILEKASKTLCIKFASFTVLIHIVVTITLFLTKTLNCTFKNSYLKHFKYDKNMTESKEKKCSLVAKPPARDILLVVSICFRLTPDLHVT